MNEQYLLQNSLFCTVSSSLNSQTELYDLTYLEQTYNVPILTNIDTSYDLIQNEVSTSTETLIPLSILRNNSSLEAIVRYLKDVSNLKFNQIARLLNRDQRTIWATYSKSRFKLENNSKLLSTDSNSVVEHQICDSLSQNYNSSEIFLPVSMFVSRRLSILESIVFYLRNTYSLSFNQISDLIGKHYQTIRTVHNRALAKITVTDVKSNYDN